MEHAILRSLSATQRRMIRQLAGGLCAAVVALLPGIARAQLPAPQLHALFPAGGRQGTIVEVRLAAGTDVDGANRLVFSHPHITAVQKTRPPGALEKGPQAVPAEFTVAIHPDVPAGIYEARCVGRFGISNPRLRGRQPARAARTLRQSHGRESRRDSAGLDRQWHGRRDSQRLFQDCAQKGPARHPRLLGRKARLAHGRDSGDLRHGWTRAGP